MPNTDSNHSKAAETTTGGAPLYKRAGLRHAEVGRGRRVHYSPGNDDSVCGRGITSYLSIEEAAARFDRGDELCAPCVKGAEEIAYAKSLAAASPAARAAAELAEVVADADEANRRFRDAMDSVTRTNNTSSLSLLARWTASLWPHVDQTGAPEEFRRLMTWAAGTTHLATLAGIARRAGHLWDHPEDAVEGRMFLVDADTRPMFADVVPAARPSFGEVLVIVRAAEVRAGDTVLGCTVEGVSVESATLRDVIEHPDPYTANPRPYDPACGCPGCEQAKSWAGPVVTLAPEGETPWEACDPVPAAAPVLIRAGRRKSTEAAVEAPQAPAPERVVCGDGRERVVTGTTNRPGEPARVVVEGGAEWLADECLPVRPAVAGVAPEDATDPDAVAALAVLAELRLATVTDEHDITGGDDYDKTANGALVDPRGNGRVAVYWLVEGLYVTADRRKPHRTELRIIADKFRAAGWRIEPGPHGCVFVWRPSAEA
ncbi:hypothetical protein [Streptomyces marianii]|uniref:Uncharacterized protein n=1 Tax=Streptomyces marianii TaxID=1817406 RepID=A0A5R9DT80_9ACTN|nr:hypothetical protein [Streptomyces marianii]TLQ38829.1 hypothetical protein FEF34_40150 [Streptomyces marianii]